MNIVPTELAGLVIVEPKVFGDARGYLLETWNDARYAAAGIEQTMVQDNLSRSSRGVLRGLHFQNPHPQAKLVYVVEGEIFDVAVDIRRGSPTFGRWAGVRLSDANHRQLFIPAGFAHGFCVLSETALVAYKCSELYRPQAEMTILWNDPRLAIDWPIENPSLSAKDAAAAPLEALPADRIPEWSAAGS